MVQQARTYLAGAVSATVLVAIAVVAFVVLVSLQALQDWPLARLGGADEENAGISNARPASGGGGATAEGGGAASASAPTGPRGSDALRTESSTPGSVDATAPSPTQPPGGPATGDEPASPASSPGNSSSSGGGSATAPPAAEGPDVAQSLEDTVKGTVTGVERTLEESAAGATEAVQGIGAQATDRSSPVGQLTEQVGGVTGGLLGGDR